MDGFIAIGFFQSVYRDSPFLRVQILTDFPERFAPGNAVYMEFFDAAPKKFKIEESYQDKSGWLVKLTNFDTPELCEVLQNKYLYVPESELNPLPEHMYYVHDLIGSEVIIEDETVGTIQDVLQMPANDVYAVLLHSGKELMVPALKDTIHSFDRVAKKLILSKKKSFFAYED